MGQSISRSSQVAHPPLSRSTPPTPKAKFETIETSPPRVLLVNRVLCGAPVPLTDIGSGRARCAVASAGVAGIDINKQNGGIGLTGRARKREVATHVSGTCHLCVGPCRRELRALRVDAVEYLTGEFDPCSFDVGRNGRNVSNRPSERCRRWQGSAVCAQGANWPQVVRGWAVSCHRRLP